MIERQFVEQNVKEYQIQEYVTSTLRNCGHSHTKLVRTPLGEKIVIFTSRPGLVVGRKGQNIKKLTADLKIIFKLDNPQIEINEVESIYTDAQIVAEMIASSLERFGSSKFKGVGHKTMSEVMNAGALGVEINITGKIPSSRAKSWRFYQGYLKKCGDIAISGVDKAMAYAQLKTGVVGIQVRIMPSTTELPDNITRKEEGEEEEQEVKIEPDKKKKKVSKKKKETKEKKAEEKPKAEEKKEETKEEKSEE